MTATAETHRCRTSPPCSGGPRNARPSGPAATGCAGTSSATAWSASSSPRASRWSPCRGSTWSSTGASWWRSSGASGSGKSTLLNILSGLDRPTAGVARVGGHDLLALSPQRRLQLPPAAWSASSGSRPARNLLPYLTARENVELPMQLAGHACRAGPAARAWELLDMVGRRLLRATGGPGQMSGGEQQRCAVAVAVANDPEVLFADEPTGELDEATGAEVFAALRTINAELGVTIVVVTHDHAVADAGPPDRRHPRRPHRLRGAPHRPRRRRRPHRAGQRGVRGARPGRPDAAAGGVRGRAGAARPGPAQPGARPRRGPAGRPGGRRTGVSEHAAVTVTAEDLVAGRGGQPRPTAGASGRARGAGRLVHAPAAASWSRSAAAPAPARRRC